MHAQGAGMEAHSAHRRENQERCRQEEQTAPRLSGHSSERIRKSGSLQHLILGGCCLWQAQSEGEADGEDSLRSLESGTRKELMPDW